ncbi:MAG: DUF1566 domain-containing protein [Pseudomonadales bacterium]|nr:DUF1566 domain-containing protein [Pseudomonadales bacterium]
MRNRHLCFALLASTSILLCPTAAMAGKSHFIKLDNSGKELAVHAEQWACVTDTDTGLTWEKKSNRGLQNKDFVTTWNNTSAFVNLVNHQQFCGQNNWRLPTKEEIKTAGINASEGSNSRLDSHFFPNTGMHLYWTSSAKQDLSHEQWLIMSKFGFLLTRGHSEKHHIRLVHD